MVFGEMKIWKQQVRFWHLSHTLGYEPAVSTMLGLGFANALLSAFRKGARNLLAAFPPHLVHLRESSRVLVINSHAKAEANQNKGDKDENAPIFNQEPAHIRGEDCS